jgi:hypothetical protein
MRAEGAIYSCQPRSQILTANVPSFWYSAMALLCWRSSLAHFPKLSCADVFPSSRLSCTISFLSIWQRRADPEVGVGSLL